MGSFNICGDMFCALFPLMSKGGNNFVRKLRFVAINDKGGYFWKNKEFVIDAFVGNMSMRDSALYYSVIIYVNIVLWYEEHCVNQFI